MDPNQRVTNHASSEWTIDDGRAGTALDETGCQEEWPFRVFTTWRSLGSLVVKIILLWNDPVGRFYGHTGLFLVNKPALSG